jgi:hypothetical protein
MALCHEKDVGDIEVEEAVGEEAEQTHKEKFRSKGKVYEMLACHFEARSVHS